MTRPMSAGITAGIVATVLIGAILFASAGRWDLPFFWAYLAVFTASSVAAGFVMDPGLVQERLWPGPGAEDRLSTFAFLPVAVGQYVVAGLDVGRFHWSDTVPQALRLVGLLAVAVAVAVSMWAVSVNPFFSSVIRIQTERGHHVVTDGPYRFVRHPGYAVAPFLLIGTGLALGSWLAALIGVVMMAFVVQRTVREDHLLHEQLPGYAAYAHKVRYRLVPGVW